MSRPAIVTGCPERPRSEADLGFCRQKPVRWFDPRVLLATGLKVWLSSMFGAYLDKRELQDALRELDGVRDYSDQDELWIDYVADLGDGFDATYSIAHLLARERLFVSTVGKEELELHRGSVLIMGGDQVYPSANPDAYENRLVGPYKAALPCAKEEAAPDLFAVPGNHDWYDGLTNFIRLFCQDRWIGGWRTPQKRSYFAMKLPKGWWLWGIDISFDAYIDQPQLDYFRGLADKHVQSGERIILCTARPSWVEAQSRPRSFENLLFFERKAIRSSGAKLVLILAGDLHHYARYVDDVGERHRITAGRGGAFLYPTHQLEDSLELKGADGSELRAHLEAAFPSALTSRRISWGAILFAAKNLWFVILPGLLYALGGWLLASRIHVSGEDFGDGLVNADLADVSYGLLRSPGALIFAVLLWLAVFGFCDVRPTLRRAVISFFHTVAHIAAMVLLVWLFGGSVGLLGDNSLQGLQTVLLSWMAVSGAVFGSLVFGTYLTVCAAWLSCHANEAFSAQQLETHKNFLRLRIAGDGRLEIFPLGLRRVCKNWTLAPEGLLGESWFMPDQKLEPVLIEGPIAIDTASPRGEHE
jgi:hypothetical protein